MSTNDLQANSDLLFCPFCGGEAHIKEVVSACEKLYTVGCSDSECMGYETWLLKPTVDEAVAAWNRRAERTCVFRYEEKLGEYACSSCGERVSGSNPADEYEVSPLAVLESFEYCPNCGARVLGE